jgi:hypothetical protein
MDRHKMLTMELLAQKISERLTRRKWCTIFENELSRAWPYIDREREKRKAQIQAFAKAHGWSATILDPGMRVTFRKRDPEMADKRELAGTTSHFLSAAYKSSHRNRA